MTVYLSDRLLKDIEKESKVKFTAEQKSAMQKAIITYFIQVHQEACNATIMASNKKTFLFPQFND